MMSRNTSVDDLYESRKRSNRNLMRAIAGIVGLFWLAIVIGVVWLIRHPEAIGHFFGKIAHAFQVLS